MKRNDSWRLSQDDNEEFINHRCMKIALAVSNLLVSQEKWVNRHRLAVRRNREESWQDQGRKLENESFEVHGSRLE